MNLAETHNKEGYFSPTEFEAMIDLQYKCNTKKE